jgi:hypothetical protein
MTIGASIMIFGVRVGLMGSQWDNFYYTLQQQLGNSDAIKRLLNFANALINFITNPIPTVKNIIKDWFPKLETFMVSTYNFLLPYVKDIINALFSFLKDMKTYIKTVLSEVIKDYTLFRDNPTRWIFEKLKQYSGMLGAFLTDPEHWFLERIRILVPALWEFFIDPRGYIMDKLIEGFEVLSEKYLSRIMKIAEKILSAIF